MRKKPPKHGLQSESVDRAESKVDVQRDQLSRMLVDDPRRPDQEEILDTLIKNASAARLKQALCGDDNDPPASWRCASAGFAMPAGEHVNRSWRDLALSAFQRR